MLPSEIQKSDAELIFRGKTTIQLMKTIYVQIPFSRRVEGTMRLCRCLFRIKRILHCSVISKSVVPMLLILFR